MLTNFFRCFTYPHTSRVLLLYRVLKVQCILKHCYNIVLVPRVFAVIVLAVFQRFSVST
jgi:hypothetical protein